MTTKTKISPILAVAALACGLAACGRPAPAPGAAAKPVLAASHDEAASWAERTLETLDLERKVGQMIGVDIRGDYAALDSPASQKLLGLIRDHGIGAFVVYGGSPQDTASLLNRLQRESALPLFFASDFEGGPGQQIAGASEFPANMALAAAGSEELAYAVGRAGAAEGRAVGIHITFSPVVDIQTRPDNPVLGVRSFGADIGVLGRLAGAYIRGYQENGMLATAKHFPGRGDVRLIPGTEFTVNDKPAAEVEAGDFAAFKKAIDAGVAVVMSEHIAVPSVTGGSDLPASVEKKLATDWLRDRLGFTGLLTTDDMWYEKVVRRFGAVEACVRAVEAGHDLVLKPADPVAAAAGIVEAVRSGRLSGERIDASVRRILYWKARLNLHRERFVDESRVAAVVGCRDHKALVARVADESLTIVRNDGFFPRPAAGPGKIVHVSIQKKEIDPAPSVVEAKLKAAFPGLKSFAIGPYTSDERRAEALEAARGADTVVISLFNARTAYKDNGPLSAGDRALVDRLVQAGPKAAVAVSYGNPYLAAEVKGAAAFVVGYGEGGFYGNQTIFADSFIRLLRGELRPKGKLPVAVSADLPLGSGVAY
ncbi:MAG TPA: glycoside hydrolase family 3 N-terminal domain-containing protein [Candidatus Aminicenantes bacterium]|nr:glycoside hydrolase family 3 N-terminal domain-containing protein [Candidatus Aminicenantes bacterium]HRY65702.1 glycoside hydrolase family 3 N-terminal domain-containing protein [Candidatus Aminicenantes bacterium]HRZ72616.1 glycoside hydrolase family 3 N-terminal domain-containing protein [Candidatus Aminicenantes bacterium]